jgi:MarR family transcriptional regulator, organic hydroperoxide resistance regulator
MNSGRLSTEKMSELKKMPKAELISKVLGLFKTLGESRMRYQFEHWRKLDVPLAQLKSLIFIHIRGSVNVRDLALDLGVTPGNVTGIVDRLVGQGLVKRRQSSEDRRIVLLEVTDKGRKTLTEIREASHGHMKHTLEGMSLEDISALIRGVTSFIAAAKHDQEESLAKRSKNSRHADIHADAREHILRHHIVKPS